DGSRWTASDPPSDRTPALLARLALAGRQVPEAVVRGVLVGLADRRIVEDAVDERVDGAARLEHHEPDVDQLRGRQADDVHAEEFLVLPPEDELDETVQVTGDLTARVLTVVRSPHAIVDRLASARLLGLTDHRHLGNGVDGQRKERSDPRLVLEVEGVDHRD